MTEPARPILPGSGPPAARSGPITAADALTLEEARALSGRRGVRLALVMGEEATGKTALLAALWRRLIESGELAGHALAGSRTALGFERRAHWQRLDSRQDDGRTPPTAPVEALMHLRVRRPNGARIELLMSDLAGEQFERVREGRPLLSELPWAARTDRAVVLLDGAALARPGESEVAATRAERLLRSLQTSGRLRESARIALVVTKADALASTGEQALARHEAPLIDVARRLDPEAVLIRTTAIGAGDDGDGLGALLAWLCGEDRPRPAAPPQEASLPPQREPGTRAIESFGR